MNHIYSGVLRRPEQMHIWKERYGNDRTWLQKGVIPYLKKLRFNAFTWENEAVLSDPEARTPVLPIIHSPTWRPERYRWLNMPYIHTIEFLSIEEFNPNPYFPDVFSSKFEEYCDWTARKSCVELKEDPYLIGYYYTRAPQWLGGGYLSINKKQVMPNKIRHPCRGMAEIDRSL